MLKLKYCVPTTSDGFLTGSVGSVDIQLEEERAYRMPPVPLYSLTKITKRL